MFSLRRFPLAHRYPQVALVAFALFLAAIGSVVAVVVDAPSPALDATEGEKNKSVVTVRTVGELGNGSGAVVLLGEVRSLAQAELRAQKTGEVTRVAVQAGARVAAGTVLAELDPAAERAAVLQAQGALQAAQAQLDKIQSGARTEDRVSADATAQAADTALTQARTNARTALSSAYSAATNAVYGQADRFFQNPQTVNPTFTSYGATYDERQPIEAKRVALSTLFTKWNTVRTAQISDGALSTELLATEARLAEVKAFLEEVSFYIDKREPRGEVTSTVLAADSASMAGARASVEGALSAIVAARTSIASAESVRVSATGAVEKIEAGERTEDIAVAQAAVTSAQGALAQAQAGLERALVRTPIGGTLTSWSVTRGDFVQATEILGIVANPQALEVEAFVSGASLPRVAVGQKVRIADRYDGMVVTRASGLDPTTKKARITVSLPSDAELSHGTFVELTLLPLENEGESTPTRDGYLIPITAIKVLPQGLAVLSVNEVGVLVAVPIEEGSIIGDAMLVNDDVSPATRIVVDARGLAPGDSVEVSSE